MKHRSSSALIYAEQSGGLKGENVAKVSNSLLNRLYKFAMEPTPFERTAQQTEASAVPNKVYINVRPLAQKLEFAIKKIRAAKIPNTEPTLQKLDAVLASKDAELTNAEELRILISTLGSILKQNNFDPPTELNDLYAEIKKQEDTTAAIATPTQKKLAHIPANVQLSLNYLANEVGKQNFRIYGPKGPDQQWGDETQKAINWVKKQYPKPSGVSWGTDNNAMFYQINALAESIKNQEATKAPSGTELAQQAPNLIAVLRQANIPNSDQPINALEWWLQTKYEVNFNAVKEAIVLIYNAIEAAKITPPRELNTFSEYVDSLQQQQQAKTSEKVRKELNKFALDTQASKYKRDPMKKSSADIILKRAQQYANLTSWNTLYNQVKTIKALIDDLNNRYPNMPHVSNILNDISDNIMKQDAVRAIDNVGLLEGMGGNIGDKEAKTEWFRTIGPKITSLFYTLKKQLAEMNRIHREVIQAEYDTNQPEEDTLVSKHKNMSEFIPKNTQQQLNILGNQFKKNFNLSIDGAIGKETQRALDWFKVQFKVPRSTSLQELFKVIDSKYREIIGTEIGQAVRTPREVSPT